MPLLTVHLLNELLLLTTQSPVVVLTGLLELILLAVWIGLSLVCPLGWAARWKSDGFTKFSRSMRLARALIPLATNAIVIASIVLLVLALHT